MQLLRIVVSQLGSIHLLRSSIHGSLSLTHLLRGSHIVEHEEHLTGTHRLTFLHIDLHNETRSLRTDFHILHTLDSSRISALHVGTRRSYGRNGKLIVAELRATTAATARHQRCSNSCKHHQLFHFHNYKYIFIFEYSLSQTS